MGARTWVMASALALGAPSILTPQSAADSTEIGRAVAENLDSINGMPVVAFTRFLCDRSREECATESSYPLLSATPGGPLVQGVVSELQLRTSEQLEPRPACGFQAGSPPEDGLLAAFVLPSIQPDSATVLLSSMCTSSSRGTPRFFGQTHEFRLTRSPTGGWVVRSRRLVEITQL